MRAGLQISRFTWPDEPNSIRDILKKIVTTAEKEGFYSAWVMDHFFQIKNIGEPEEPMLEAYTTLGFIAGLTEKIKLGTMVTGVIYRNPSLLIKAVTTLDVLSKGRAYFGVGAAWNDQESIALGFPFPSLKERFQMLEETLKIANQMWNGDETPYKGKQYVLERPMNHPVAITQPHPPILIGGGGEQKTLKFVAKYADACNLFARLGFDVLEHKLIILKEHCKALNRNYDEIEKTALYYVNPDFNPKDVIKDCKTMHTLGIDQVIFGIKNVETIKPIIVFGKEILPEISGL